MSLLIFPPFADPTQSYPALPLLKGYAKSRGFDVDIVDFNLLGLIDAANETGDEDLFLFRDEERFYDAKSYESAERTLRGLYQYLSRRSGFLIDNNQHFDPKGPWSIKKLHRYIQDKKSPFHRFYEKQLNTLVDEHTGLVGINLTFTSQIPEAFYLVGLLKKRFPRTLVIMGGALIGQIVSQVSEGVLTSLLRMVDGICYFDGGPALVSILTSLADCGRLNHAIPNFLYLQEGRPVKGEPVAVDFSTLPLPVFDGFQLDRYLAPSPIILFHPASGCYWNRCSFCRYGFNQEHGGQYREMAASYAVSQLQTLKDQYRVSNFYMSVDVLRPAFVVESARLLMDRNVNIKWSTDLRIEKSYTKEQTDLLSRSGLVSVAFGVESACDPVLKKMNKGINRERISQVNRLFWASGIAPCWMMFHYHPGESVDEAMESVLFLEKHRKEVSLFIIGEFGLTPHSEIFNKHTKYGIRNITYHPDDDFRLYPFAKSVADPSSSIRHTDKLDCAVSNVASHFKLKPYPFAGAISTHHSMLYFIRFGQSTFQR
jgi:radical SAM superfamily enzyme YgiQ (UPF0313 family)